MRPTDLDTDAPPGADLGHSVLAPQGERWRAGPGLREHDNPWFAVDTYDATAPTGAPAAYYALHYKNAATGVIPLHEDGTVTLVGQWRFPFGTYSWELPEGGAPLHEPPLDGARRELAEEAGLAARDCRLILRMQLSNASSDEAAFIYLATGLEPTAMARDATEALALARPTFSAALSAAVDGRIQDSMTVAGLLRLHHMAVTGGLDAELVRRMLR